MTPKPQPVSVAGALQGHSNSSASQQPQTSRKDFVPTFWETYENLCVLQNVMPLQSLKSSLSSESGAILNLNADKLKSSDWEPIFGALKTNKTLRQLSVMSNYVEDLPQSETNRLMKGFAKLKKPPSIRNKDRINKFCRCLKECLQISVCLTHLELYNLPLTVKDLGQIAKGLRANKTLSILSMDRCQIGDEGLAIICKDIQSSNNLNRINFSSCNLTQEGAEILANLIKVQALKRHNEAWKDSLRYGRPDLDSMFGIRRITINSNPLIGDHGVYLLSEAFKSDLWLKALDLQDCGITTIGANHLLDGLKFNAMMHVLDVRLNVDIDRDTLQKIMEQVMINSSGHSTDYEWMDLTQAAAVSNIASKSKEAVSSQLSKIKIKKRRNTNASFSKKSQFMSVAATNTFRMKRCKSTGSVILNKSPEVNQNRQSLHLAGDVVPAAGIPWRTAARADRYRAGYSCSYRKVMPSSSSSSLFRMGDDLNEEEKYENLIKELNKRDECDDENELKEDDDEENQQIEYIDMETKNLKHRMRNLALNEETYKENKYTKMAAANSTFDPDKLSSSSLMASSKKNKEKNDFNLERIKNLSVQDMFNILQREQQFEEKLTQLKDENVKLKSQINFLKQKLDQQQQEIQIMQKETSNQKRNQSSQMNRTLLDDEALEIIELTLHKYKNFLDFLRNAGFGKLIEIGEMDQKKHNQRNKKQQSRSPTISQASKLTDQQRYYLDKISKTKSKLISNNNKNIMESTQVSAISAKESNTYKLSKNLSSHIDIFDEDTAGFSIDGIDNHHIDNLLPSALEISRSYRRLNSSSVNSSMVTGYKTKKSRQQHFPSSNETILTNIKETSGNPGDNSNLSLNFIEDSTLLENIKITSSGKQQQQKNLNPPKKHTHEEIKAESSNKVGQLQPDKQAQKLTNISTASTVSPATTIIANTNAPQVSARKHLPKQDDLKIELPDKKDTSKEEGLDDHDIDESINKLEIIGNKSDQYSDKDEDDECEEEDIDEEVGDEEEEEDDDDEDNNEEHEDN